jgi:hypothetical protein
MEKVDAIGEAVFNHHALRLAFNKRRGSTAHLSGHEEGRLCMAEVSHGPLAQGTLISFELEGVVKHARSSVSTRDVLQSHAAPG